MANRRGHFNRDVFKSGDRVCLQDPTTRRWNILGTVSKELIANDGSTQSYEISMDKWQELVRNGSHIRHSEREPADPEQRIWLDRQRGMGTKPRIPVDINLPNLSIMPHPSNSRKVQNLTIILISHISIVVAILALVTYPYFPDTVKLTLENFKAAVSNLVVWVHNSVH